MQHCSQQMVDLWEKRLIFLPVFQPCIAHYLFKTNCIVLFIVANDQEILIRLHKHTWLAVWGGSQGIGDHYEQSWLHLPNGQIIFTSCVDECRKADTREIVYCVPRRLNPTSRNEALGAMKCVCACEPSVNWVIVKKSVFICKNFNFAWKSNLPWKRKRSFENHK